MAEASDVRRDLKDNNERGFFRIATEEAFAPPEMYKLYKELLDKKSIDDPGFESLCGFFVTSNAPRAAAVREKIQDLGELRLKDMDDSGVDKQIISLTSPGVQVFDTATANSLAISSNDQLAEAVRNFPDRFAGLAACAPQDPASAAKEIERAVKTLGLKGVIINSHTRGEYFSDPKFWDIFAAAEYLNVPVYLHPNTPPASMIKPFLEYGLDGAIYGFAVETGLHLLRIIMSGAFDRFPNLKLVVGHLGEAIPFWLFRIDFMHRAMVAARRYEAVKPIKRKPSEYMYENVFITTSGMAWEPAITYVHSLFGPDRLMYAMDYPYQFVPEEVEVTDNLPLGDEDMKKFYQLNAEKVFSL